MGIGDFVSNLFGSKNKTKATAPTLDQSSYQYGGHAGGAHEAATRYAGMAQGAQGRGAEATNLSMANADRDMSLQARSQLGVVGQSQLARAMGQTPSISGMQAQQDMQRMQAQQAAQAASARGAAGIAGGQRNAAYAQAAGAGQISNQAQINAANERLAAENAAANTFGAMRGGDQSQQGLTQDVSKFDAGLRAQQRAQNDAFTLGMTGNEMGVRNAQLTGGMNYGAQSSANAMGAQGINAGVAGQNANMNQGNAMNLIGMGQGAIGASIGMGKADGGPVGQGRPYVVGERGPELVVPKQDSVVIPNHALARADGGQMRGINPTGASRPSPADIVVSTWGTGPGMTRAQAAQAGEQRASPINEDDRRARERDERLSAGGGPQAYMTPMQDLHNQDEEKAITVRSYEEHGIPVSERDQYEAENAERRLSKDRRASHRGGAPPPKQTLSQALGTMSENTMSAARQPMALPQFQGYQAPQLIPIAARQMGGPLGAGQPSLVGEAGPEIMQPYSGVGQMAGLQQVGGPRAPAMAAPAASATFAGAGGLAGGSVGGEDAAHKAFGARFARNPTAYGDADGGPVPGGSPRVMGERGPEQVVPLGNPMPGVNLHVGNDGRAFYQHDIEAVDDGRPRIESRGGSAEAAKAKASPPKAKAAPASAPRKMTDAELLAEADRQIAGIQSQERSSMAQGPAVRMPVTINKVAKKYALADFVPRGRKRQAAESSGGAVAYLAPPIDSTLPPPKPPPIEATREVALDSPVQEAIYDYGRSIQGEGGHGQTYDLEGMLARSESVPFWKKMKQIKGRR